MFVTITSRMQSVSLAILAYAARGHRQACLVLILATLLCALPGFFVLPVTDRDEGRFAQASKQMIETGDLINIRYQNEARNKKPVGIHWMQVAAATLSGYGSSAPIWVYRLPSLLGAIAAVLLTYWALLPLLGRPASLMAAMLMASLFMLGIEARIAKTDAVLLATTTAAMGALIRAYLAPDMARRTSTWLIFWLAMGAGLLIKGPITPMVVTLSALVLVVHRRSAAYLLGLRPLSGMIIALLITLPWFIAIAVETQGEFYRGSLSVDMFAKIGAAAEQHWGPPGYYTGAMWIFAWPAAPFLLIAAPWIWAHRRDEKIIILLAWLVPTWLVFELVTTKLPHYVLPAYPALTGLVGAAIATMGVDMSVRWRRFWLAGLWAFPLLLGAAAVVIVYRLEDMVLPGAIAAIMLAVALGWMATRSSGESLQTAVPLSVMTASLLYFAAMQSAGPALKTMWLSRELASKVSQLSHCPAPRLAIAAYHEPSFVFLTRTDTQLTDIAGAASFLAQGGCRLAIIDARRQNRDGVAAGDEFRRSLATLDKKALLVGDVTGRNVNGFDLRRMEIWRLQP